MIYGQPAGEFIDGLFRLANKALSSMEKICLMPLSQLAQTRKTLAMLGERAVK